ncbi:uncharacterized protein LOC117189539 isoform X1 [Drosophila miranda]|uniref:uncharacterized protein LOC117189539 isoform X1 n=1 Tax=Drosophila miranda TaxID=7229 RepID=UPI00143FB7EC|nr:uncharacterized protein LOC117189539 isoform X1 [Drosophila miranda]
MDDEDIAIISAVVQQQNIFLHQLIMLLSMNNDDDFNIDEDEMTQMTAIKTQKPGRLWSFKRFGTFWEKVVPENNEAFFKESFRMERPCFDILVNRLEVLGKKDTNCRAAIPLEKRIAIALYTLGSSSEYRTVGRLFGVAPNSVCNILHEFCRALIDEFSKEYMSPNYLTSDKIDECVKGFEAIGFPQCLGAIDGCHIEIKPPAPEAVDHHNYKGWYSTVLFALVDYRYANILHKNMYLASWFNVLNYLNPILFRYRFTYVNIGSAGRCNDSMIYQKSSLAKHIEASTLLQEKAKEISAVNVPVMLIGDSAFRFSKKLMKPYPFSQSPLWNSARLTTTFPKLGEWWKMHLGI